MSTCPENDIHSIYLDGELPCEYAKGYLLHIEKCTICQTKLKKLRHIKNLLRRDADSIVMDKNKFEECFDRLQVRRNYMHVTHRGGKYNKFHTAVKWGVSVAAAAVVLSALIPMRVNKMTQAQHSNGDLAFAGNPLADENTTEVSYQNQTSSFANGNVVVSGNLSPDVLYFNGNQISKTAISGYEGFTFSEFDQKEDRIYTALTCTDVFRPEFADSDTISVRISIPRFYFIPVPSETPIHHKETQSR